MVFLFFFKQKTAYEMRISDWSSDVCSSDLLAQRKKNTVGMLELLRDATARLPDGTWLERLSVDATGQIGMQGQSQQAAKLLDALKDSSVITVDRKSVV